MSYSVSLVLSSSINRSKYKRIICRMNYDTDYVFHLLSSTYICCMLSFEGLCVVRHFKEKRTS